MHPLRILHLEDDPFFADMASALLTGHALQAVIRRAESYGEFEKALREGPYDLILSDHEVPGGDGLQALSLCRRACPHVPFIFVTGRLGEELAIESLRKGAADYVLKSNMSRFLPTVARTLEAFRESAALRVAEERIRRDRANLHAVIENTLDAIWSMDRDFRVLAYNSAASLLYLKLTGQPLAEDIDFLELLPPSIASRWREAVRRVRGNERFREEHRLEWMGKPFVLEVAFNPILSRGEVVGVAVFAKDVSARKREESAAAGLEIRRSRLAAGYRRMRVPLRSLERAAGLLERAVGDGELRRPVALMAAAVRRLSELHARAEAGSGEAPGTDPGPPSAGAASAAMDGGERTGEGIADDLRILVVEDNRVNRMVAAGRLGRTPHSVVLAGSGEEALRLCAESAFDLVLMDCRMPGMDGLETARAIRRLEASRGGEDPEGGRAYIAALTAAAEPGLRESCLEAGMDAFLAKPLTQSGLEEVLAEARLRRSRRSGAHGGPRAAAETPGCAPGYPVTGPGTGAAANAQGAPEP